jgi:hypothetical protein
MRRERLIGRLTITRLPEKKRHIALRTLATQGYNVMSLGIHFLVLVNFRGDITNPTIKNRTCFEVEVRLGIIEDLVKWLD